VLIKIKPLWLVHIPDTLGIKELKGNNDGCIIRLTRGKNIREREREEEELLLPFIDLHFSPWTHLFFSSEPLELNVKIGSKK